MISITVYLFILELIHHARRTCKSFLDEKTRNLPHGGNCAGSESVVKCLDDARVYGCMYVGSIMYVCIYVCMHVYTCAFVHSIHDYNVCRILKFTRTYPYRTSDRYVRSARLTLNQANQQVKHDLSLRSARLTLNQANQQVKHDLSLRSARLTLNQANQQVKHDLSLRSARLTLNQANQQGR
jgi:hypothetical protein